ncbi:hypothetical protein BDZ89DRAFT_1067277 [Hymenopellis radicata]|nr:hypothetical protein BDZ89DRAFT_1067277 [Hymenopellis radicata]
MSDVALSVVSALIAASLYHIEPELLDMDVDDEQPDVVLVTPNSSTLLTLRRTVASEPGILAILRSNRRVATSELNDIWTLIYQLRQAREDVYRCIEQHRPRPTNELRALRRQLQWHIKLRHAVVSTKSIRNIPYDILVEIFKLCLSKDDIHDPNCTRWMMMQVCYTWRDAILSVSSLWSTISLRIPIMTPAEIQRFNLHIRLSANRPLVIFVDYFVADQSFPHFKYSSLYRPAFDALQLLLAQWERIRGLHIRARGNSFEMRLNLAFRSLPMLEELTIISPGHSFSSDYLPLLAVERLRRVRFLPYPRSSTGQPLCMGDKLTHLHVLIDSNDALRVLQSSSTIQTLRIDYRSTFNPLQVYQSRVLQAVYESVTDLSINETLLPFVHTPNVQRLRINGPSTPTRAAGFLRRCGQNLSYLAVTGELILDAGSATIFSALQGVDIRVIDVTMHPRDMARVLTTVDHRIQTEGPGVLSGLEQLILRNSMRTKASKEYAAWKRDEVEAVAASAMCLTDVTIEINVNAALPDDNWQLLADDRLKAWTWSDLPSTEW